MSRSEFKYNKKRKHYSYLFKDVGDFRKNILLTTDSVFIDRKKGKPFTKNKIPIYKHPNRNKWNDGKNYFIVNHKPYIDYKDSFSQNVYPWKWDKNDKKKVKRFKKYKKNKKFFDNYGK